MSLLQEKPPKRFCLVFYGRPMMTGLRLLAASRGWIAKQIPDTPEGIHELEGLVSPPPSPTRGQRFFVVYTTSKAYRHAAIKDLATSKNALIAPIENINKISGPKRAQITSFRNYLQTFGCSLEELKIMPVSFILGDPLDCVRFLKYSNQHPEVLWLLKPSSGKGGSGITIHPDLTFLYKAYATSMYLPNAIVKGDTIAQECITNPLLIENRKCDIRAYNILLAQTSPHYLVFYHDGYVRVSIKEFDVQGDRDVHITNSQIQKTVEGFSLDRYFWSFQDLQDYLDKHRPQDGADFVSNKLVPFIQKIGFLIVQTATSVVPQAAPSSFQMMGLDIMVTDDLCIKFLETNNYPLWPRGTECMNKMMYTMWDDMFNLLFECRQHPGIFEYMKLGDKYGTWSLIWSDHHFQSPYSPRREFSDDYFL